MHNKVPYWVRLWLVVRGSPALYRLFLTLRGLDSASILPTVDDRFFITGYQRSGNSYSKKLCEKLFPSVKFASHVHTVASLKMALDLGVPVVVLIRDPDNSVASSVVQQVARGKSLSVAVKSVHEYVDYYAFLLSNFERFTFILFEDLQRDPAVLLKSLSRVVPDLPVRSGEEIEQASREVVEGIKAHDTSPESHGWHSPEKEESKKRVLSALDGAGALDMARAHYERLKDKIVQLRARQ